MGYRGHKKAGRQGKEKNGKELPVKQEENMGRIFTEAYRRQS